MYFILLNSALYSEISYTYLYHIIHYYLLKKNLFYLFQFFILGAGGVKKPVLPPINPKTGKPFEGDEFDKNPFKNTG